MKTTRPIARGTGPRFRGLAGVLAFSAAILAGAFPAAQAQTVTHDGRNAQTIIRYDARHHPVIARRQSARSYRM